jgi:hypothetical protein
VVADEYSDYFLNSTGDQGAYILTGIGASSGGTYYVDNVLSSSPVITQNGTSDDYQILRLVNAGQGAIAQYSPNTPIVSTEQILINFEGSYTDYTIVEGTVTGGVFEGDTVGAASRCNIEIDITTRDVTQVGFEYFAHENDGFDINITIQLFDSGGPINTFNEFFVPLEDQWITYTHDFSTNNEDVVTVRIIVQLNGFPLGDPAELTLDDITITSEGILQNKSAIQYSTQYGASPTTLAFGNGITGSGGFDADKYNAGVFLGVGGVGGGSTLYASTNYSSGTPQQITGIANSLGTSDYLWCQIPALRFSNSTINNRPGTLDIAWAAKNPVNGATVWYGVIDAISGTINGQTSITPVINGTSYRPVEGDGHVIDILASNPDVWIGCFRTLTGTTNTILYTGNAGQSWISRGAGDYLFARWNDYGNQGAYFAGTAGLGYSSDRGVNISDKTENYSDVGTVEASRGFIPIA